MCIGNTAKYKILLTAVLNFPMTTFPEIDLQNYFKAYSFGIVVVVYMFGCVIIFIVVKICCVTLDMPWKEHWLQYILGLNVSIITKQALPVTLNRGHVQCHLCCVLYMWVTHYSSISELKKLPLLLHLTCMWQLSTSFSIILLDMHLLTQLILKSAEELNGRVPKESPPQSV